MKLPLCLSLLLILRADAFHHLSSKTLRVPSRRSISGSKLRVSLNQDDLPSRQRLRNGLKRLLRKPKQPQENQDFVSILADDKQDNTVPITEDILEEPAAVISAPEDLETSISVRMNASTNLNSVQRSTSEEDVNAVLLAEKETKDEIIPAVMTTSTSTPAVSSENDNLPQADDSKIKGQIASWRKPKEEKEALVMASTDASLQPNRQVKTEDERDNKILHILGLMAGTLWWYVFSTFEFLTKPDAFDIFDIYSSGNVWLYNGMSIYVTVSQLCTYFFLWKLMTTNSLREGQAWIGLCIMACVPADTIVILFDPTGSKSLTVLAFTLVTLIYGVLLAYYLREAAALEPNPTNDIYKDDEAHNMIQEVIHYRPPGDLQNTHMALDFARSFGAFTITMAAMRDQLGIGEVGWTYYAVLFVVVAHAGLEMTLTTVTPGLDLCKYKPWIKFQTLMSLFEMFAATYIAHVAPEEDLTIWDDLVYSCLFGSAAAALQEFAALWGEDVDWDKKLKMANSDVSMSNESA